MPGDGAAASPSSHVRKDVAQKSEENAESSIVYEDCVVCVVFVVYAVLILNTMLRNRAFRSCV